MPNLKYIPRLAPQATELIDRSVTVEFQFDGRTVRAHEGDTIAAALHAAGVSTISRSFKYHRSRGLLCGAGRCPNCLVSVDGVPNVRACTQRVREGMKVRHQNAWPSLKHDFLSILDRLHWLMPVGFYYKAFHRPKALWPLAQRVIRRIGGLGTIDINAAPETDYHHRYHHADVAVVGGGPAGLSAALAAADRGARVTLIDDQPRLGGHLRFNAPTYRDIDTGGSGEASGVDLANDLSRSVEESPNIQVMADATAFACYQDNLLGVLHGNEVVKLRAKQVVLATGAYEAPLLFENNDLPGVMLTTAAQRLIRLYGVRPGATAVIATNNDAGYQAALDLLESGVGVAVVVDARLEIPPHLEAAGALRSHGITLLASHAITRAEGKGKVRAVTVAPLEGGGPAKPAKPDEQARRFRCDLVCMSGGFQPANALLYQAGGSLGYDDALGEAVPQALPPGLFAAGEVTGIHHPAASLLQGRLAGLAAAANLGLTPTPEAEVADLRRRLAEAEAESREGRGAGAPLPATAPGRNKFV